MRTFLATASVTLLLLANAALHAQQASAPPPGQIPAPQSAQDVPKPVAGSPISPAYAAAVARMAYIWGYALVNMHNREMMFSKSPHRGLLGGVLPVAPIGQLSMLSGYLKPEQRFVTSPNQDVVYGAGFFSLDKQPVVIQVPDFDNRFWVYQIVDQRSDSFVKMGAQYHTKPGMYLLVGPNWKGTVPKGITAVYKSSTGIAAAFPRVFMDDTSEDRAAIQPVIDKIMAYPLSKYTGKMKSTDWQKLPTIKNPNAGGSGETQWVVPDKFFDQLPTVMDEVPPLPGEQALYAQIRFVLNAAKDNPELQKVLKDTAISTDKDIVGPMFQFRNNGVPAGNGWQTQKNSAEFGYGYFQRTATAKGNMFSNVPKETTYYGADSDSKGNRLNGSHNYTVTFKAGQTPPNNGFWSLTLYNEQHFFVPNKLNRYSVGTKNKDLKKNADGSLTIYVQPTSPGADKESNWLPSPTGNFSIYIRDYWPKAAAVDGTWTPPVIKAYK